ncbi:MAG: 3-deoxy-8-phosphooctulonate synthase [Chromatiales bacterium]|jgi:2-dehydro-3-deoxyphosphooctonate aldolase (KDO 8-P synthase)|nr:3-deoxy-8-phosphooctulonate synthase [Chromatiales bacterium]
MPQVDAHSLLDSLHMHGPQLLLAGPCAIESREHARRMARIIQDILRPYEGDFRWVFKSSFDKANRTSINSPRGVGIDEGLRILQDVKAEFDVPIVTDIHESHQAAAVAEVADILQIPAFLCRQTDLLVAAAETGRVVNVKKGQFLSPDEMRHPVKKVREAGGKGVTITERGTSFGYNNLIVDYAGLHRLRQADAPVIFDATHCVQLPGGLGESSGGRRELAPVMATAAAVVGVEGFFLEVHDDPDNAFSDGPNQITPDMLTTVLGKLVRARELAA